MIKITVCKGGEADEADNTSPDFHLRGLGSCQIVVFSALKFSVGIL